MLLVVAIIPRECCRAEGTSAEGTLSLTKGGISTGDGTAGAGGHIQFDTYTKLSVRARLNEEQQLL